MLYSRPIMIGATTTIKAIAYAAGMANSATITGTFTINTSPAAANIFGNMIPDLGYLDTEAGHQRSGGFAIAMGYSRRLPKRHWTRNLGTLRRVCTRRRSANWAECRKEILYELMKTVSARHRRTRRDPGASGVLDFARYWDSTRAAAGLTGRRPRQD